MGKPDIKQLVGRRVTCSAIGHEGEYYVLGVNTRTGSCKIQRPDESKAHWVKASTVKVV